MKLMKKIKINSDGINEHSKIVLNGNEKTENYGFNHRLKDFPEGLFWCKLSKYVIKHNKLQQFQVFDDDGKES